MEKMWPVANLFRAPMISISLLHPPPKRNKNAHHFCLSFPSPAHSRVKDIFHRGSRGKELTADDDGTRWRQRRVSTDVQMMSGASRVSGVGGGEGLCHLLPLSIALYYYGSLVNLWHLLVYFWIFTSTIQWLADEHEGIFHIKSRDKMEMLIVGSFPICFH